MSDINKPCFLGHVMRGEKLEYILIIDIIIITIIILTLGLILKLLTI